jgi:hypothetical protein
VEVVKLIESAVKPLVAGELLDQTVRLIRLLEATAEYIVVSCCQPATVVRTPVLEPTVAPLAFRSRT